MGIRKKLLDWCPRPKKQVSKLLTKLAILLHFRKSTKTSRLLSYIASLVFPLFSLSVSLILFYLGTIIFGYIVYGSYLGPERVVFQSIFSFLFLIPVFLGLWVVFSSFLERMRKKGSQVLLFSILSIILIPAGIVGALDNGLFDSITLLEQSGIDLYNCRVSFNIKNNGLTDVQISTIEIGNVTFYFGKFGLERGKNATLALSYGSETFDYWINVGGLKYWGTSGLSANCEITPITFIEGRRYPVVVRTEDLAKCGCEVEAGFSKTEEIFGIEVYACLEERTLGNQTYYLPYIWVDLDMALDSVTYIHSIDIGNLTIWFDPPICMLTEHSGHYQKDFSLSFYPDHVNVYSGYPPVNAIPNQSLNVPIFEAGETYNITIRTMMNNNYTTSITMFD